MRSDGVMIDQMTSLLLIGVGVGSGRLHGLWGDRSITLDDEDTILVQHLPMSM